MCQRTGCTLVRWADETSAKPAYHKDDSAQPLSNGSWARRWPLVFFLVAGVAAMAFALGLKRHVTIAQRERARPDNTSRGQGTIDDLCSVVPRGVGASPTLTRVTAPDAQRAGGRGGRL